MFLVITILSIPEFNNKGDEEKKSLIWSENCLVFKIRWLTYNFIMNILIVEVNETLRSNLKVFCQNLPFKAVFSEAESIDQAELICSEKPVDYIILSERGHNLERLGNFCRDRLIGFPDKGFLFIARPETEATVFSQKYKTLMKSIHNTFNTNFSQKEFSLVIVNAFRVLNNVSFEFKFEEYTKVRVVYFQRFNKVLCDIYIKLSSDKFVKVLKAGDTYGREDILKYRERGVEYLYLSNNDLDLSFTQTDIRGFLTKTSEEKDEEISDLFANNVEVIQDLVKDVGISDKVVNLVDYSVYQIESQLKKNPDQLTSLFVKFQQRQDYLSDSAYIVSYISCQICSRMEWDSEETRQKLIYASMLHDVMVENSKLAMAVDLHLKNLKDFTRLEIDEYKKHPQLTAELIKLNNRLPINLDEIVLCHHENPEGTGFPRGLDPYRVSQLAAVFIIARNFTNELYRVDFQTDKISSILSKMNQRFSLGNYKKAMKGLLDCYPLSNLEIKD